MSTSVAIAVPGVAPEGRRILRVGIIQGKRIVEERLLPEAGPVTIGRSPRSTFILPSPEVPWRWRLFDTRRGRRVLLLPPEMSARVVAGADVLAMPAGTAGEAARPVVLPDGARGKVIAGDTTILFQLVREPAPRPRPQLPPSVRPRVLGEIDGLFAAILALTFLAHVAIVVYLRQVDWPRRPRLDEVPDRFVRQWLRPAHSAQPPAPARQRVAIDEEQPRPRPPAAHPRRAPVPTGAASPGERHAAIEAEVRRLGVIPLLTARGADGASALRDLLSSGGVDRPLEDAFRNVNGIALAADGELRNLPRATDGHGKIARVQDLRAAGKIGAPTETGAVAERDVRSNVVVERPALEAGVADPELIARELRARRKAIAACYERALKQQPTLGGKLVLRFTITAAGTVGAVTLDEDTLGAPDVVACVRGVIARLRFPTPADGAVEVSFPFVFAPAN